VFHEVDVRKINASDPCVTFVQAVDEAPEIHAWYALYT